MSRFNLRHRQRISYYEPEEPSFDDYIFCVKCSDYVYEYCSIHGGLLIIPDDEVPEDMSEYPSFVPRAALTIPQVFLYITTSTIPGAGVGVYASRSLPAGIRFGPYRGRHTRTVDSDYCWQIYKSDRKPSHVVDGSNKEHSNWMRYVNCSRHALEQNVVAFQYKKEIYYRTLRIIPKNTELLVYYGPEFAQKLGIDVHEYNTNTFRSVTCKVNEYANIKELADENVQQNNTRTIFISNNEEHDNIPTQKLLCDHCNVIYKTKPELIQHIIYFNVFPHSNNKNAVNIEAIDVSKQKTNEDGNDKSDNDNLVIKSFNDQDCKDKCDYCDKVFTHAYNLNRHVRIHTDNITEEKEFCYKNVATRNEGKEFCYKNSATETEGKIHATTETSERRYRCDSCDKKFTNRYNLKLHIRTHTDERNYTCSICNKSFKNRVRIEHMRSHTGEKPFQCVNCDRKFTTNYKLKFHMRIHTGENNYTCKICNRSFKSPIRIDHMRSHTGEKPFQCDNCHTKFTNNYQLKMHMRKHTGEKPYNCSYCDKKFRLRYFLTCHLLTHTGERPYICEICRQSFQTRRALKRHTKIHISTIV